MLEGHVKKDIEKISLDILNQSNSLGSFPTPVDQILHHTELTADSEIDLSIVDRSFFERVSDATNKSIKILQAGLSNVRGFFDRTEKTIYVDVNQNAGRQGFVKLHEAGHSVIPWQSPVMLALDNKETLVSYDDEFEAEANHFASVTLFQHHVFLEELVKLPLGVNAGMALAKKFGSSVHAALRNYVLQSKNRCALLVLTPINGASGNKAICETRNLFYSKSFADQIGELELPDEFGFKWNFVQDFKFNKRFNEHGVIELTCRSKESLTASYHYFYNSHNIFVFLFPKGEKNKVRTKIIMHGV